MPSTRLLPPSFFARPSFEAAPELLGKVMCYNDGFQIKKGIITETEAYEPGDPACHGYRRKTPRNAAMWAKPGTIYVYLTYGIHHCMNVACTADDVASALLIRALNVVNEDARIAAGPAKLCKYLGINLDQNHTFADGNETIWFEEGEAVKHITQTTRIGITKGVEIPWRWYITGDESVSVKAKKSIVLPK